MNKYDLPKRQWKKWNEQEQDLFNDLLTFSLSNQRIMSHPMSPVLTDEQYKTVAWNHAWMAADFLRERRKLQK